MNDLLKYLSKILILSLFMASNGLGASVILSDAFLVWHSWDGPSVYYSIKPKPDVPNTNNFVIMNGTIGHSSNYVGGFAETVESDFDEVIGISYHYKYSIPSIQTEFIEYGLSFLSESPSGTKTWGSDFYLEIAESEFPTSGLPHPDSLSPFLPSNHPELYGKVASLMYEGLSNGYDHFDTIPVYYFIEVKTQSRSIVFDNDGEYFTSKEMVAVAVVPEPKNISLFVSALCTLILFSKYLIFKRQKRT